jgi:hypothetical protein
MTDVYNYERTKNEQFNQGLSSAFALEGLTMPTPQRVEFDISKARSLEGLTNKSSEGTGIANIVGRPGYVGSMYKMGDAYYPAGEGSLTDSLNSIASFVKDNPRLSAETTALSLAGTFGRLSGQGGSFADFLAENANAGGLGIRRGTVESMRGELSRPASAMDVVDATTYATPGAALKGLGLVAKGTASAAKAGRAIGGLAVGSKPTRVATGLAAGVGGYAGYTEAKPEEAEAFPLRSAFNLSAPAKVSGRMRTEADRILKQINQTTRKRFGSGEGLGQKDIESMTSSYLYNPMNRLYIDRVMAGGKVPGGKSKELVGAHETGKPPSLGGPRNPTLVQSGELNRLEQAMREAGEIPNNSMDILNWAIKSHPKHIGKSIIDMLQEVGT